MKNKAENQFHISMAEATFFPAAKDREQWKAEGA
jgi:hypothetical protein